MSKGLKRTMIFFIFKNVKAPTWAIKCNLKNPFLRTEEDNKNSLKNPFF